MTKKCMYCEEEGRENKDVFIEVVDRELGPGWICKEHFIESEKEEKEMLRDALIKIKNGCTGVYTRSNECKQFKAMIMDVINEVLCDE